MDQLRAAPGLLFAALFIVIGIGVVYISPMCVILAMVVVAIRKARSKRRHRYDAFVSAMLK